MEVNSSLPVATLYLGPMGSRLWAYIEGMDGLHHLSKGGQTAPIWLPGPGLALLEDHGSWIKYASYIDGENVETLY